MFVISFLYLKISQNLFSCRPPFGSLCSVKYFNFVQKLPIWTVHLTFLESRHPGVTKNLHYVWSLKGNQKNVSAHGLLLFFFDATVIPKNSVAEFATMSVSLFTCIYIYYFFRYSFRKRGYIG